MDLTVFPLYADGSTGDALVEQTGLDPDDRFTSAAIGSYITDAARNAERHARHAMEGKPVALDITLTLDTPAAMTRVDAKTAEEARQHAIDFQAWAASQSLSYGELADWLSHFEKLGKRFGLTDEFKENGVL